MEKQEGMVAYMLILNNDSGIVIL